MVLAVVGVVIQAGTLNLQGIVAAQADGEIFGFDGIGNPYILTQFVGFVIFLIAMQAELDPDAVRHADRRVRARHRLHHRVLRHAVPAVLHRRVRHRRRLRRHRRHALPRRLGAARGLGDLDSDVMQRRSGRSIMLAKMMLIGVLIFWVRFTFPRFREDQLQRLAWKSSSRSRWSNILATTVLKVAF